MTLAENYQICQVIEEILNNQEEEYEDQEAEEEDYEEDLYEYGDEYEDDEEEEQYDDWGLEEKPVGDVIKEKIGGWGFVKRLFGRGMEAPQDDILREQRNVDCRKKY